MSLIERMDLALLVRADAMVAWNRDRGRADQWALAKACPDIAIALLAAAFLVDAATSPRFTGFAQLGYVVVSFVFGFIRAREGRSIRRLSGDPMGSMRARTGESEVRELNILIMGCMLALCVFASEPSDVPFLMAVAAMGATNYFKAAEPPPPAPRRDEALAPTG